MNTAMKKYILSAALLVSALMSAQVEPKHEIENGMVKSTYYHTNGTIAQTGYYKDGKVHGQWVSYDEAGNKTAIAEYREGEKTGKWFFWTDNKLSEVDYSDSRVAAVKTWTQDAIAKQ